MLKACIEKIASLESKGSSDDFIKSVFSIEALSKIGISPDKGGLKLLSDIDILSKFKLHMTEELINEYFERRCRRHAVWKSYSEYSYLFKQSDPPKSLDIIFRFFSPLIGYLQTSKIFALNDVLLVNLKNMQNRQKFLLILCCLIHPVLFQQKYLQKEYILISLIFLKEIFQSAHMPLFVTCQVVTVKIVN